MSLIEIATRKYPAQLAFDDGEVKVTYADVEALLESKSISQLASLRQGQHVAWSPGNDFEAFLTFWAIQQRDCVACPISHRFPVDARIEIIQRLDACWLPDLVGNKCDEAFATSKSGNHPSTIILSSGSTGTPKAIVHSMAAHVASAEGAAVNMPLEPDDRWLWSLPLCHVSGLSILVRCAVAGATVVGVSAGTKLSADLLEEQRVTHLSVVTTQLRRLLREKGFPSQHLKAVLLGGSSVDEKLVNIARKRGVPVATTYGLTEMATQVTTSTIGCDSSRSGRVLDGRQLKIESNGEILVRGKTLCLGYYVDGEIQSVVDDEGWFHTRDLGSLDDNQQLKVSGRIDNMFISGGENIYPENIERAMRAMFDLEQVIVVPRPDEAFGSRPVAFVCGDLPTDWQVVLEAKLKRYEIPVEALSWPAEADGAIKPNRKQMQLLVARGTA